MQVIQVATTVGSRSEAESLGRAMVERRLAACAQVSGPITSIYHWQGRIETAEEWLCTLKTLHALFPAVEAALRELHPYDTPEILGTPAVAISEDYRAWLTAELRPGLL